MAQARPEGVAEEAGEQGVDDAAEIAPELVDAERSRPPCRMRRLAITHPGGGIQLKGAIGLSRGAAWPCCGGGELSRPGP